MVQEVALSKDERATVLTLHHGGKGGRRIAQLINCGRDAVHKDIRCGSVRSGQSRWSITRKLRMGCVRNMLRVAHSEQFTATELQLRYANGYRPPSAATIRSRRRS